MFGICLAKRFSSETEQSGFINFKKLLPNWDTVHMICHKKFPQQSLEKLLWDYLFIESSLITVV